MRRGEVEAVGLGIEDPNPARREIERAHDLAQRGFERAFDVGRGQRARDRVEQRNVTLVHER